MDGRNILAFGFMTRESAQAALSDMISAGEVSAADHPLVQRYEAWSAPGADKPSAPLLRFCITLAE